jgi:hypothetical protein
MRPARPSRLLFGFAMAACLATAFAHASCPQAQPCKPVVLPNADPAAVALLDEAIAAAGGQALLAKVAVLHWSGEATVFADDRRIELGVRTNVLLTETPHAYSETWLRDDAGGSRRTLTIDADGGRMMRDNETTPMPEAMLAHERLQYATYRVILLEPLRSPFARLERRPDVDGLRVLHAELPGAAPADLFFDASGHLVRLDNVVPDPEGKRDLAQRFDFVGQIDSKGVRWPRTIRISQDGKPYFELRLSKLEAIGADELRQRDFD